MARFVGAVDRGCTEEEQLKSFSQKGRLRLLSKSDELSDWFARHGTSAISREWRASTSVCPSDDAITNLSFAYRSPKSVAAPFVGAG
jgi:hypothetical protein